MLRLFTKETNTERGQRHICVQTVAVWHYGPPDYCQLEDLAPAIQPTIVPLACTLLCANVTLAVRFLARGLPVLVSLLDVDIITRQSLKNTCQNFAHCHLGNLLFQATILTFLFLTSKEDFALVMGSGHHLLPATEIVPPFHQTRHLRNCICCWQKRRQQKSSQHLPTCQHSSRLTCCLDV